MLLSVKEVAQELEMCIISMSVADREIPAYRTSKMLRFNLERIQRIIGSKRLSWIGRPCGARSPANCRRRAQQKGPRSVKRGHYPQRSLQEVQRFYEFPLHTDH